jgi:hypothetical protein
MKPTAPLRENVSVFAMTPCRGLSLSRSLDRKLDRAMPIFVAYVWRVGAVSIAIDHEKFYRDHH